MIACTRTQALSYWIIGAIFYLYSNILTSSLGALSPYIKDIYHLNNTHIGFMATVYFSAYAIMQIPVGWLLDRYALRNVMSSAGALCIIGMSIMLYAPTVEYIIISRFIVGLGASFAALSALNISSHYFHAHYFAFLTGLLLTLGSIGAIIGQSPLHMLLHAIGYTSTLYIMILLGIIVMLSILCVIPHTSHTTSITLSTHDYAILLTESNVWCIMIYGALMYAPYLILQSIWGIPLIEEILSLDSRNASSILGFLSLGFLIGSPVIGHISDQYTNKNIFLILSAATSTLLLVLLLSLPQQNTYICATLLAAFGVCSSGFLISFNVLKLSVPSHTTSLAMGLMNTINTLGGVALPPLIGHHLTHNVMLHIHDPYRTSLYVLPLVSLSAFAISFFIRKPQESV